MSGLVVKTNNVPRPIIEAYELSAKEREEFDYLDWNKIENGEDSASFFRYKNNLYDLGDVEFSVPMQDSFRGWDFYVSETFFSGIVGRYVEDSGEYFVVIGRYYS